MVQMCPREDPGTVDHHDSGCRVDWIMSGPCVHCFRFDLLGLFTVTDVIVLPALQYRRLMGLSNTHDVPHPCTRLFRSRVPRVLQIA